MDAKRARNYNRGVSNGKVEIQYKKRFNQRFPNQISSIAPRVNKDWVPNPKTQ